jgi:hypothetical protein
MPTSVQSLCVVGVPPIVPTSDQFQEALHVQWGKDLVGKKLTEAEEQVRAHIAGLYLLEIEVNPADAEIDWMAITQPVRGQPRENWQVPYEEQRIGEAENRWVFFFHSLDLTRPLQTEVGDIVLPSPTPLPPQLSLIAYNVP